MKAGAQDYLVKNDLSGRLLVKTMKYAQERKAIEASLRVSEARFRSLADLSSDWYWEQDALRRLGLHASRSDAEALLALWRYSSHLMGVAPELQCSTEAEGWRVIEFMAEFEGAPDDDSRALMDAVMTAPYLPGVDRYAWRVPMAYDLSRELVGEDLADALGYPAGRGWGWLRRAIWPVLAGAELLQRAVPPLRELAVRRGTALAETIIAQVLAGARPQAPAAAPSAAGAPAATGARLQAEGGVR